MTAKHRQRVQKFILSESRIGSADLIKSRSVGEFLGRQVVPSRTSTVVSIQGSHLDVSGDNIDPGIIM